MPDRGLTREQIAQRVAADLQDGMVVNLGIGMPTLVANFLVPDREVVLHSENGLLGMGPLAQGDQVDPELVNAGKQPVTLLPGGSFFHQADSFAMTRAGHVDVAIMGAFQVAANGDLANWRVVNGRERNVGGAMDIAVGAKQLFIMMSHTTRQGDPKLVARCTYPITARGVVRRVFTDLAVIDVTEAGFLLRELAAGLSVEEVQFLTAAPLTVPPGGPRTVPVADAA
jgi:3-oxoacid CoA-transferase B subunit